MFIPSSPAPSLFPPSILLLGLDKKWILLLLVYFMRYNFFLFFSGFSRGGGADPWFHHRNVGIPLQMYISCQVELASI